MKDLLRLDTFDKQFSIDLLLDHWEDHSLLSRRMLQLRDAMKPIRIKVKVNVGT